MTYRSNAIAVSALLMSILFAISCSGKPISVDELKVTDIKVGDGKESITGKSVSVHYTGWVYDWTKKDGRGVRFDSSHDRGVPFTFSPGSNNTIQGWEQGVPGMREGGRRELLIPAEMAYGDKIAGRGKIPANSALLFEIDLIMVRD